MPSTVKTGGDAQIPEWLRKQSETIAKDRETVYNILHEEQAGGNRLTRTTLRQKCEEFGLPSDKTLASDRFKSALNALLKEGAVKEGPEMITCGFSGDIPIKMEVLKAVKSPLTKEEYFKSVEKDWRELEKPHFGEVKLQTGKKGEWKGSEDKGAEKPITLNRNEKELLLTVHNAQQKTKEKFITSAALRESLDELPKDSPLRVPSFGNPSGRYLDVLNKLGLIQIRDGVGGEPEYALTKRGWEEIRKIQHEYWGKDNKPKMSEWPI